MSRFPEFQPGDALAAETFNRTNDAGVQTVEQLDALQGSLVPLPPNARGFWARLTGESPTGEYQFRQVRRNATNTDWVDVPSGLSSDASSTNKTAKDYIGAEALHADATDGWVVWIEPAIDADGGLRLIFQARGDAQSPQDLTYSGEHQETALGDTGFDPDNPGDNDGVKLTLITGVSYYHAGDQKLYCYARDLTLPSWLRPFLSAERRVTVDNPESCPT